MTTLPTEISDRDQNLSLAHGLLILWGLAALGASLWWMYDPQAVFFAAGSLACVTVTIPLIRATYSVLSPWTLVVLACYVGCGLRSFAISAHLDTNTRSIDELFLLGHGPEYFVKPSLIYLIALATMTAAFMAGDAKKTAPVEGGVLIRYRFHRNLVLLAVPLAVVGLLAFVMFAQRTGGFALDAWSIKYLRGPTSQYSGHGVLRFLNNFSAAAFWVVAAAFASQRQRVSVTSARGWVLALFALNAIVMPIYVSSRTDAVFTLMFGFIIMFMIRPRRLPLRAILVGAILLTLMSAMTFLRANAQSGNVADSAPAAIKEAAADALIYNRNFGDMETASHVINAVPDLIPYKNGSTIVTYVVAPIPRSIWRDKPVINVGPLIGYYIYGSKQTGVPPGFVGDLFLNFGFGGVLIGAALIGRLLRRFERWRIKYAGRVPVAFALLYVPTAFVFTQNAVNKGIGAAVFNSIAQLIVMTTCLWWVGSAKSQRRLTPAQLDDPVGRPL